MDDTSNSTRQGTLHRTLIAARETALLASDVLLLIPLFFKMLFTGELLRSDPKPPDKCPHCGSTGFQSIMYGYPNERGLQRAKAGEIVLGGCRLQPARWFCSNCQHRWPKE